ncbi:uncharacterized protein [Patagioenas fasciata]|uniref:uncharacterized protein isoform X1 n=1 Tax=Patagioenas fasciata TaxID=372321 RepID=UPI003A995C28
MAAAVPYKMAAPGGQRKRRCRTKWRHPVGGAEAAVPYKMAAPWGGGNRPSRGSGCAVQNGAARRGSGATTSFVTSGGGHGGAEGAAAGHGLSPGSSGFGPLRDLPDWSFVDGRPAPLWKGQQRRLRENEELARRAVGLIGALDAAASRGRPTGVPAPQLRPKGSQRPPGRSGTDQ